MYPIIRSTSPGLIQRLNNEQQEKLAELMEYFVHAYTLTEVRQYLQDLVRVAVTTKNTPFAKAKERARIVAFCDELERLAEAIMLVTEENK